MFFAQSKTAEALEKSKVLYKSGERMQALKLLETLDLESANMAEQQAILYNMGCCHTAFGDIESAKMSLRGAIDRGLNFEEALTDPQYIKMEAAAQLRIQLKRFAKMVETLPAENPKGKVPPKGSRPIADPGRFGFVASSVNPLEDVEGLGGIDTSIKAVAIRVALVLILSILGFAGLFVAGLQFFE